MEDKQLDMVGSEAPRSRVTTERIKCSAVYKGVGVVKGQLRLGSKTGSFPVCFFLFLRGPFAPSTKTRFVQSCGGNVGSTSHLCGMKNGKLRGKDFFDAANNPTIVFRSTKFVQTSPNTIEVDGDFTIRGATQPEKLTLIVSHKEGDMGEIEGKMNFNRKDYGMNKGIPFVRIGDHVDVTFNLNVKHVSGPQVTLSEQH